VGAGPEGARVVAVTPVAREVAVVGAGLALPVVALVEGTVELAVTPATAAGVLVVVSMLAAVELEVLPGGPATANSPPRRNDGGPLWVIL
jgi:hypothetical protein